MAAASVLPLPVPVLLICLSLFAGTSLLLHWMVVSSSSSSTFYADWQSRSSAGASFASSKSSFLRTSRRSPSLRQQEQEKYPYTKQKQLLLDYNRKYPPNDWNRTRTFIESLRNNDKKYNMPSSSMLGYDIYNCPSKPPQSYPATWNMVDVLQNWNPKYATMRPSDNANTSNAGMLRQGLCVFDYQHDLRKAIEYRKAEVPFVLAGTPQVWQTAERWNRDNDGEDSYLMRLLTMDNGDEVEKSKVEHSANQHFMYWKERKTKRPLRLKKGNANAADWKPPTDMQQMTYREWLEKATTTTANQTTNDWYYFRYKAEWADNHDDTGRGGLHSFLYDELPIFRPTSSSLFMVEPQAQRGINCRFGMEGVLAEAHYDSSRNFICLLKGNRRYILAHPRECSHLELYPVGHPSARHSAVDWTNVSSFQQSSAFASAQVNEVVLQAGDVLYLPTHWFHFIQSLDLNYQCNARSGTTLDYLKYIQDCGFPQ